MTENIIARKQLYRCCTAQCNDVFENYCSVLSNGGDILGISARGVQFTAVVARSRQFARSAAAAAAAAVELKS